MKSIKHLILMTALLGITGSISQVYAMERGGLDEPAGAEEERKESMEQYDVHTDLANIDLLQAAATKANKPEEVGMIVKAVKDALLKGADIKTRDPYSGDTVLHKVKNAEIAHLLIARGADVNVKNKSGKTPLHTARSGAIVAALLDAGAILEAQDMDHATPLQVACTYRAVRAGQKRATHAGRKEYILGVVDSLLAAGANPKTTDQFGRTTLEALASKAAYEIRLLKTAKLRKEADSKKYKTAEEFEEYWNTYNYINEYYENIFKPLVSKLIRYGAQPFNMRYIKNQNITDFINHEFEIQNLENEWVAAYPTSGGPAIVEQTLQKQGWPAGVPGVINQYLSPAAPPIPEEQDEDAPAATAGEEREKEDEE